MAVDTSCRAVQMKALHVENKHHNVVLRYLRMNKDLVDGMNCNMGLSLSFFLGLDKGDIYTDNVFFVKDILAWDGKDILRCDGAFLLALQNEIFGCMDHEEENHTYHQ